MIFAHDFNTTADDMRACLSLIERHCPRLMAQGGGSISRENSKLPDGVRAAIIKCRRENPLMTCAAIGEKVGVSQTTVSRVLISAGMGPGRGNGVYVITGRRFNPHGKGFVARNPEALQKAAEAYRKRLGEFGALTSVAAEFGVSRSSLFNKVHPRRSRAKA